jgi:NADP-dependent aldehyde dehydrogenase
VTNATPVSARQSAPAEPNYDPSFDPRTGTEWAAVAHSTPAEVTAVLQRAEQAAAEIAATSPAIRRGWLKAVAATVFASQDELAALADEETGLGLPRLTGEIAGAARSVNFYADVAVEGSYLAVSSDIVNESVSIARWNVPVGPVAVFGASNFPFGFGVVGHDVASALAAGCPVIAKAHPAHPRLSVRLATIVREALAAAGAPDGTYDLVVGFNAGLALVDAPQINTVAFTGSQRGGMAILARAAERGVPVFAEMGTVNPIFVTPAATQNADHSANLEKVSAIATGFVASFTLGAGQFCTKPGVLFAPAGSGMLAEVQRLVAAVEPAPLLTAGIAAHFVAGAEELAAAANSDPTTFAETSLPGYLTRAQVVAVTPSGFTPGSRLLEECFGPIALVCEYEDADEALATLALLQGSLAASVFTDGADDTEAQKAISQLLPKVGRVAVNAWPTGVANTWSQQHGGPWPATSRPEATSVGAGALGRFVRPVALQNATESMLPPVLVAGNPWQVPRRINGILQLATD